MSKQTLTEAFNITPKAPKIDDLKDYDIFHDKKLLDNCTDIDDSFYTKLNETKFGFYFRTVETFLSTNNTMVTNMTRIVLPFSIRNGLHFVYKVPHKTIAALHDEITFFK